MNKSVLSNKVAMSKNMTEESTNFAVYMRSLNCNDIFRYGIKESIEGFAYEVADSEDSCRELKNKLCSEFDFILAWFAFDYLYNEYEICEIGEDAWQYISDALSGITAFEDSVQEIYQVLDNAVYTINHDSDIDFWM